MQIDELKRKATAGMGWSGAAQIVNQATQMIVTIVLARLLLPRDFGLIGMAMIFINMILPSNELGLGSAIVQSKNTENRQLSTIFWISSFLGSLSWLAVAVMSPVIARFFNTTALQPVIVVMGFIFLMEAFILVHRALLMKSLDFRALALAGVISSVVYGVVAVILALVAFQVWSLVIGAIARSLVYIIVVWKYCRWRPSFEFDLGSVKELLSYGINLWGSNMVAQISRNADHLIVGKFLGATALGYYTIAFKLAELAKNRITGMISGVAFPALSAVQDDDEKIRKGYMKITRYTSVVVFPILVTLIITANKVIPLIYGAKWVSSVLPFQILAVMGLVVCATHASVTIFLATGLTALMFRLSIISTILLTIFALSGLRYGIVGVSIGVLISSVITTALLLYLSLKPINLRFRDFLKAVYPPTAASFALGTTLVFISPGYLFINGTIWLFVGISLALAIYLLTLRIVDRDGLTDMAQMVIQAMPRGMLSVIKRST